MKNWLNYPDTYRKNEINRIITAIETGDSVSVIGLSGAGKSNLFAFLANQNHPQIRFFYVDGNRLQKADCQHLFQLIFRVLRQNPIEEINPADYVSLTESELNNLFSKTEGKVSLIIDRFDMLSEIEIHQCGANLRALRDIFKYHLTYVLATRRPISTNNEISELIFGNTIWLGSLTTEDAYWSINEFCSRKKLVWPEETYQLIYQISQGYPSFLRAICEAHSTGCPLLVSSLKESPVVKKRLFEFFEDQPTDEMIQKSGLSNHPLIQIKSGEKQDLTEKEFLLLTCLQNDIENVVEKDIIIKSVWPEDKLIQDGIRDDSLAQLIRRLRRKLEKDSKNPYEIITIIGRGYKISKK